MSVDFYHLTTVCGSRVHMAGAAAVECKTYLLRMFVLWFMMRSKCPVMTHVYDTCSTDDRLRFTMMSNPIPYSTRTVSKVYTAVIV